MMTQIHSPSEILVAAVYHGSFPQAPLGLEIPRRSKLKEKIGRSKMMTNTIKIKIEIGKAKGGGNQTKFESETVEKIEYHVSNMKKIPKDLILKDMARIIKQLNRYRKIKWS